MKLVKLQATKSIWTNLLHFYTLAMKMRKRNLRNNFMDYHINKNEIHRNKTTKGFTGSSDGKESACSGEDLGLIPDDDDPLEKGMATHCSILAVEFIPRQGKKQGSELNMKQQTDSK